MPEPMPMSWLSPIQPQPQGAMMRHLSGAALGLTVGLVLAVPAVLWQKGRIDPVGSVAQIAANFGLAAASPKAAVMTEVREPVVDIVRTVPRLESMPVSVPASVPVSVPVEIARPAPAPAAREPVAASASVVTTLKPALAEPQPVISQPVPPAQVVLSEAAKAEALLEDARRLVGDGDFRTARSMLEDQLVSSMPAARFLLAETYDPNYLAARGVRSVRAEVPRAMELYRLALDGGIEAARQRINALRP